MIDYVSPEQIRGDPAGTASDVYALTAVLFECLCGRVPFPQPSDVAVLNAHLSNPPPRVTSHRPELSPAVDDVIARGMAKEPGERQTSATEMIVQAERAISTPAHGTASLTDDGVPETVIRDTTGSREQPAAAARAQAAAQEPAPVAPGERGARLGGWRKRVAVAVVLLLVLAAGAGLASLAGDSDPPGGAATTTDDDGGERQGNQITMRSVPGTTAVANAGLIDYGEPPPTLRLQVTPGGPRYQLLLFQALDSVRTVQGIPRTAMLVFGGGTSESCASRARSARSSSTTTSTG